LVETPGTEFIHKNESSRKVSESMHPLKRIGKPEEIASMVELLISEEGSWVTGQVISMDGGLGHLRPGK